MHLTYSMFFFFFILTFRPNAGFDNLLWTSFLHSCKILRGKRWIFCIKNIRRHHRHNTYRGGIAAFVIQNVIDCWEKAISSIIGFRNLACSSRLAFPQRSPGTTAFGQWIVFLSSSTAPGKKTNMDFEGPTAQRRAGALGHISLNWCDRGRFVSYGIWKRLRDQVWLGKRERINDSWQSWIIFCPGVYKYHVWQ